MTITENWYALRIYLDESYKLDGATLYEKIILVARELNLKGATVFRGIAGFGAHKQIHAAKILEFSQNLPLMVEIIDQKTNLDKLLNFLSSVKFHGLITLDKVNIVSLD